MRAANPRMEFLIMIYLILAARQANEEVMISFDNPDAFVGFSMWEAGGDHNDLLLDAIRGTAGF
ncbi:hypothetical protein D9758_010416 [Tetrapyrgos nigripes]|uniref:Uncharacterized protein n=1 Tax=Tetrapyrgos nigripes TaxID=182062 RepID=A0A8H5FPR5_9AGAR|nr:hypothetical protein D9758_010416 [Tetrapyrgos nigripes]